MYIYISSIELSAEFIDLLLETMQWISTCSFTVLNRNWRKSYAGLSTAGRIQTRAFTAPLSCQRTCSHTTLQQHCFCFLRRRSISSSSSSSDVIRNSAESVVRKRVFDEHLNFPTEFMIKIVGVNEPSLIDHVVKAVSSNVGPQEKDLKPLLKETANGKYVSVTVKPVVRSAEELYTVYAAVQVDPRVKFVL